MFLDLSSALFMSQCIGAHWIQTLICPPCMLLYKTFITFCMSHAYMYFFARISRRSVVAIFCTFLVLTTTRFDHNCRHRSYWLVLCCLVFSQVYINPMKLLPLDRFTNPTGGGGGGRGGARGVWQISCVFACCCLVHIIMPSRMHDSYAAL